MTGNAINAKSEALCDEELDAVFGGWFCFGCIAPMSQEQTGGETGNNDSEQKFRQILWQLGGG